MKDYRYSDGGFYPYIEREMYELAGKWPLAGVDVSQEERNAFIVYPEGKLISADADGYPVWVDAPPLEHDELVAQAADKKRLLIEAANDYMNSKQWPGKAAIGRLSGDGLAQYNLWLDYLDALEAVGTSTAPDITWPTPTAE